MIDDDDEDDEDDDNDSNSGYKRRPYGPSLNGT